MSPAEGALVIGDTDPSLEAGALRLSTSIWKRVVDILGAGFGLIVLSPLFVVVSVAILLGTPGEILFRQRRSGYRGAPFLIYKFRTMRVAEDGAQVVQATRDDQRITWLGAMLRRTSIDELPQLINVLKGEMSLVGPRPHALAHDEYYGEQIACYVDRFMTRPGLTGLAQVCGLRGRTEDIEDMAARIDKDLEYIRDWSLWLDIKILLKTVVIFLFQPAAY